MEVYITEIFSNDPAIIRFKCTSLLLAKAMPGDALTGRAMNPADPKVIEEQREKLGLNDPVTTQYVRWIKMQCKVTSVFPMHIK